EIVEFGSREATFKICAGIHTRRGMALEENEIAREIFGASAEEVVKTDFVKGRGAGKGGNMSADTLDFFAFFVFDVIGFNHHSHGVPAHDALDASFDFAVARIFRFHVLGDSIYVRSVGRKWDGNTGETCGFD